MYESILDLGKQVTFRRQRKIVLPSDSTSSSEDHSPLPLSSSRLRADFRDLSPGSKEELRERGMPLLVHGEAGGRSLGEATIG